MKSNQSDPPDQNEPPIDIKLILTIALTDPDLYNELYFKPVYRRELPGNRVIEVWRRFYNSTIVISEEESIFNDGVW